MRFKTIEFRTLLQRRVTTEHHVPRLCSHKMLAHLELTWNYNRKVTSQQFSHSLKPPLIKPG